MVARAEQRRLVWSGKMRRTTGGLTRDDLMLNRSGRIVSKKKSQAASKVNNLGTWLRVSGQGFKEVPSNAKKGTNGKGAKKVPKKAAPKKVVPKKAAQNKVAKAVKKIELKAQKKKKLDSKKTVVALKKKAEAKARANSKAGHPLSKTKAPEVVAAKASKAAAASDFDAGSFFTMDPDF
jgi:hypothetical protein